MIRTVGLIMVNQSLFVEDKHGNDLPFNLLYEMGHMQNLTIWNLVLNGMLKIELGVANKKFLSSNIFSHNSDLLVIELDKRVLLRFKNLILPSSWNSKYNFCEGVELW